MIQVSDPYRWITPMLTFAMILMYIDWRFGSQAIFLGGLSAGVADWINARLIKPNVDRIRPGKQMEEIKSLGSMNRGKRSFPSNHASNTISIALSIGIFFPMTLWFLTPLVILVGYSRVYCGAHYPLDVLVGWLHGSVWVLIFHTLLLSLL
ncbi:MAG: phosphatase PAP2 family protein [Candidatus Marinimicrobia bacterium]|nr:phosphatase PAP2 family protein [Candidatus Neomarinimicrobiota bacterium]MCF7850355.1 phosphatase PAP2 family protein [Candidatus Neomarinimicrobiota bacterium]MCF7904926.1 phosphatase PAP2 family protein [Candidatus Neomarinimicrobiota bacterium]